MTTIRPALLTRQCTNYHKGSNGLLVQCRNPATHRITVLDTNAAYAVKRCTACRAELLRQAERGGLEILADEEIGSDYARNGN